MVARRSERSVCHMSNHYDLWLGIATVLIVTIAIASCLARALVEARPAAARTTAGS
jgi:hypothetical protein